MSEDPVLPVEPAIRKPRRWLPSAVWLIPLLAALVGISLVIQAIWDKGPTITVSFTTAEGIEAGKTKVKYKDVDIGTVMAVHLAEDRSKVLVTIELVKEARGFAVADSRFWVVRPRFASNGVSGLETVLSGSYIGVDAGKSTEDCTAFVGLENPPAVTSDVPGRRFHLVTDDIGSLDIGSPVLFHRIPVGHVESVELDADGRRITLGVFVKAPYDRYVLTDTRFWEASGVDFKLDANGVKVNTQSLATILAGGVAFETPVGATHTDPATEGTSFPLGANRDDAMNRPDGHATSVLLRFHQSVRGLSVGSPVDFRGVDLGRVRWIGLSKDKETGDFTPIVIMDVYSDRLVTAGLGDAANISDPLRRKMVTALVKRGLRAQLRPGSLLTGQLYVALDFFPDAKPAPFNPETSPIELPTVPSNLEEIYEKLQAILSKLDKVPFDTLGQDAHRTMADLDVSVRHLDDVLRRTNGELLPEVRDSLEQMRRTLDSVQTSTAADAPLQQDTRQALREMTEAARSMKALADSLERQPESLLRGKKDTEE